MDNGNISTDNNPLTTSCNPNSIFSCSTYFSWAMIVTGLLILIIIGIIIFIIIKFTHKGKNPSSSLSDPGGRCQTAADCKAGLSCNGICTIPENGSCVGFPNNCATGTTCVNGLCTVTPEMLRIQAKNQRLAVNRRQELQQQSTLQGTVTPLNLSNTYSSPFPNSISKDTCIFLATRPDMSDAMEFFKGQVAGGFCYGNTVFLASNNNNQIYAYNMNSGDLSLTYIVSPNLTIKAIELIGDKVYIVDTNNNLYVANITDFNQTQVNFILAGSCEDIIPSTDMLSLYKRQTLNDPIVIPTGDRSYFEYTSNIVTYVDNNGVKQDIQNNGNYPMYHNNNLYWVPYTRAKSYNGVFMGIR